MELTRDFIKNCPKNYIQKGKLRQADVFVVDFNSKKVVIKDYKYKNFFTRILGRILIKRETKNYYFLQKNSIKFIPDFYGKIDEYALGIEYISSETINDLIRFKPGPNTYISIGCWLIFRNTEHIKHPNGVPPLRPHSALSARASSIIS